MSKFSKLFRTRRLFVAWAFIGMVFCACKMTMGMGDIVDTTPPHITIISPYDGQWMSDVSRGDPITLQGEWSDNVGVTAITLSESRGGYEFTPDNGLVELTILKRSDENTIGTSSGTWRARIRLAESGDYRIEVTAEDKFKNKTADRVNIRVDLVDPLVSRKAVKRILDSGFSPETELNELDYFETLDFQGAKAYQKIKWANIDEFQNEGFTLKLQFADSFSGVAASRLFVLNERGDRLNAEYLTPDRNEASSSPEWDISAAQMLAWDPAYARSGHYLSFEVWAWNEANWQSGQPIAGETHREQTIGGVVWYPESDAPHIAVQATDEALESGLLVLDTRTQGALILDVFDDDKLAEIYAGFITKTAFDNLRGSESEADYLESLTTNAARRDAIIAQMGLTDLFDVAGSGADNRRQVVRLDTDEAGEFRLIAIARDSKGPNSHYGPVFSNVWGVQPPLKIHVQDPNAPIVIVTDPDAENTFPTLVNGTKFNLSGYTIDKQGVEWIQIAWVPGYESRPDPIAEARAALAVTAESLSPNGNTTQNGIKIWKINVGPSTPQILNDVQYVRNDFTRQFDILTDFPGEVNARKLFVIHARNTGLSNEFKSFRMANYNENPTLTLYYPWQDMQTHNTNEDLILHMEASANFGIGIKQESLKITDVTSGNSDPNYGFDTTDPATPQNQKQRKVPVDFIKANFGEGSRRTYQFEAEDILGNRIEAQRTMIMSNIPALLYIMSSQGTGLYGINEILRFEAVFSMPVRAARGTGDYPRLKLYFGDPGINEPPIVTTAGSKNGDYATYVPGSVAGNTLVFEYTVKSGDSSNKLYTSLKPIDLPDGARLTTLDQVGSDGNRDYLDATIAFTDHANSLQARADMRLDGVQPKVTTASFVQTGQGGSSYFNLGKTVTLKLRTDEPVQVSGKPRASISYGGNTVNAEFASIRQDGTNSILEFTWLVNVPNIAETQLAWASNWIRTDDGSSMTLDTPDRITDVAGNLIDLINRPTGGNLNGNNANERAYVDTSPPNAPTFTIHATTANNNPLPDPILANTTRYVRILNSEANATLYYSPNGGTTQKSITAGGYGTLEDDDVANKDNTSYKPSEHAVTAWQVDRAGNSSPFAADRSVTINSRAPELEAISCLSGDGSYPGGSNMTFRLHFSRPVRATQNNANIRLTLVGTDTGYTTGTFVIPMQNGDNGTANSVFQFRGTVTGTLKMKNIKATTIELPNVVDDYGNTLKTWNNTASETASARTITTGSTFNLQRPNLAIISTGPYVTGYVPDAPGANQLANGGIMVGSSLITDSATGRETTSGNKITLTFTDDVWAQAGGTITVRPYGTWALPPILTTEELNTLINSTIPATAGANATEYQHRLKWVDSAGLPAAPYNAGGSHWGYNAYVNNTNGLVNTGGKVRPDTSSKWVLAFRYDLYGNVNEDRLREVFNTAKWKWQEIPSTSGSVTVNPANRKEVTIILGNLEPGRIWEVQVSAGAFRDAAGNGSDAVAAGTYRFWSAYTAKPVIRVDKHSHGDHYQGYEFRGDQQTRPEIDTRVRIDCETPGANIRYATVRTSYIPAAGGNVFSSTDDTALGFFDHPNVNNGNTPIGGITNNNYSADNNGLFSAGNPGGNMNLGYNNNSVGNGGNYATGSVQSDPPKDSDGFFAGLLVPITSQTASVTVPISQNGAVNWTAISGLNPTDQYRTVAAGGTVTSPAAVFTGTNPPATGNSIAVVLNGRTFERFFYVGDAYGATNANVSSDTDARLYSGRRDYIAARAEKTQVTANNLTGATGGGVYAGGALAASSVAYEGVFKTTLLYRNFGGASNRFLIQGFDTPVIPSTPGFPVRLTYVDTPPSPKNQRENTYYTKQAYREGATLPNGGNDGNVTASGENNNYIWVSWDIVTDWYQMAKGVGSQFNFLQRNSFNYNGVLATYGAVTYRYLQNYTGGTNPAGNTF